MKREIVMLVILGLLAWLMGQRATIIAMGLKEKND
jgi:hypothetical protein